MIYAMRLYQTSVILLVGSLCAPVVSGQVPDTVSFDSADGKVKLTGYLYLPDAKASRLTSGNAG